MPDDVLEPLRGNGGVCMVTFVPEFVSPRGRGLAHRGRRRPPARSASSPTDHPAFAAFTATWSRDRPKPTATLDDVVAHVEHVREVAGVDHVGLGGDYDGTDVLPVGLEDVTGYPRLLAALADRGWSDDDLAKLAGGNVLRVLRDAEAGARELQATRGPSLARSEDLDGAPATAGSGRW